MAEANKVEKEKRIYQVGLMLRRKPQSFILEYIGKEWGLEKSQAYNYIKLARKEWQKYFKNIKGAGIGYHIAQVRDLKDIALTNKDTRLAFEIAKEEAKLMGIYPSEKHDVKVEGELKIEPLKVFLKKEGEKK
jgi:hypothetical protein